MPRPSFKDVKKGMEQVRAVHNCPKCQAYLEAIKEHQKLNHPKIEDQIEAFCERHKNDKDGLKYPGRP